MGGPLVLQTELPAGPERVWRALVEEGQLRRWLAPQAHVEARVGGAYELFWEPEHPERNSTAGCTIVELRPPKRIAFTWAGPVPYADLMNVEPAPTRVAIDLAPAEKAGSTLLVLSHTGWGSGPRWEEARAWHDRAWRNALGALVRHLG